MIELSLSDAILDAVDILVEDKISGLQFNKTIRGKIASVIDESIGQYKIQYQNSYFTAYSADSDAKYVKGSDVYVEILSNDFERNAIILGTVRRLGSNYITIIEELDRYVALGAELGSLDNTIQFCSYDGSQSQAVDLHLDPIAVEEAAAAADSLKVAMKIKTTLDAAQRAGGGNYGLKIVARYYDDAYIDKSETIDREYLFDINNMIGQPYKYVVPTEQYTIFPIDAENLIEIVSVTAFCEDFPNTKPDQPNDIFISDINLQFLRALTSEELENTCLNILTPLGNYFSANNVGDKILKADLRVKGKKVNYDSQQVDFYWFKRNLAVDAYHEGFSLYGGTGWECLNKAGGGSYLPTGHEYTLSIDKCTARETIFKCVAVFIDSGQSVSLSSLIKIKNRTNDTILSISSSSGTVFSFNTGKTTLTLHGYDAAGVRYCWTESIDGGTATYVDNIQFTDSNSIDVEIATPAATLLTYECSVFNEDTLIGTASINLINNHESLGLTLIIKDSQQLFKYDSYGVSPVARSKAAADRMTLPLLSFDIYDKQGNVIDIPDSDKVKYMKMRWIWPTEVDTEWAESKTKRYTMLSTKEDMELFTSRDIANNRSVQRYALLNKPTFTYSIIDRYNAVYANSDSSRNNIRLEVEYQGEFLTATTNFTFTKEGELGTNGTKYIARIEPLGYEAIFIRDNKIYGIKNTNGYYTFHNLGSSVEINSIFSAQLWDGSNNVAPSGTTRWSMTTSTLRNSAKPRLTISGNNVIINANGTSYSNIIQAQIDYGDLQFYATYPIIYTTGTFEDKYLWITNGYNEVMYESDGTRGKFNPLPFIPKWLNSAGYSDIGYILVNDWSTDVGWAAAAELVENTIDQFTIEPPAKFLGETVGHYVKLSYQGIDTYLPIEFYLNRYGMSAMNGWDGTGIQVNNEGGYILAPQVGAGRKNTDNSFTGITIGEVFQDVNHKEIGMFGYYKGQRSLFLDAETGDAEFGITGKGQIKIHASDGEGTIDSGDYYYNHRDGTGTGLKIKFTSTGSGDEKGPYIKYGSGNFMVDSNGHITAQGGGSIAGWSITDDYFRSKDSNTTLYSDNGPNMVLFADTANDDYAYSGRRWKDARKTRLNIANRFKVDADGAMVSTAGVIGGWKIGSDVLKSKDNKMWLYSGNDGYTVAGDVARINVNEKFSVLKDGTLIGPAVSYSSGTPHTNRAWEITPSGVAYFSDVKIQNKNTATRQDSGNSFTWYGGAGVGYAKIFELTDTGSNIGGWNITGNSLNSGLVSINSTGALTGGSVLSVGSVFALYGSGDIATSGNITSNGNITANNTLNAHGSGNIGGMTFSGGNIYLPGAGKLFFGGEAVSLNSEYFMTSIESARVVVSPQDVESKFTPSGSISSTGTQPIEVNITSYGQCSGQCQVDPKTGSGSFSGGVQCSGTTIIYVPSGFVFAGSEGTATSTKPFVQKIEKVEVKWANKKTKALNTGIEVGPGGTYTSGMENL